MGRGLRNPTKESGDGVIGHVPCALACKIEVMCCYPVPAEEDFECLDMESTWAGMERCAELGLCKCIGLSNFSCTKIDLLLQHASIPPVVNQVEMHPLWRQNKLRDFYGGRKIHVVVDGTSYHRPCFKCSHGRCVISPSNYVAHEVYTATTITLSSSWAEGNFNQLGKHEPPKEVTGNTVSK